MILMACSVYILVIRKERKAYEITMLFCMCVCFGWWTSFHEASVSIMTCRVTEPHPSYVRFEVLMTVTMKSAVFCDVNDIT
jgi:hypothetical protein